MQYKQGQTIMQSLVGDLVREAESNYVSGTTHISKYVESNMYEDLNKIDAYLNSVHISGRYDSMDREKPFFNIVTAAVNIWYRATDIDRKNIKIRAPKVGDATIAFLANVYLQNWMRQEKFGTFLNDWGRSLARYGSSVLKFVEKDGKLHCMVVPWSRLIVDPIDFDSNIKIEVLELTEAQLRQRPGYDKDMVDALCTASASREDLDKEKKDQRQGYIKLYEVHGMLPLSQLTGKEKDKYDYVQQMHVISFVAGKEKGTYDDYTLYSGREDKDPYMITHLIAEDGQTLSIGAVKHLFEAQWMMNHTAKAIKDQLDLASKMIFQTADGSFVGQNMLQAMEQGDILIHKENMPLTQLNNGSHDISALQSFASQWKSLANEIVGTSESMLGNAAPSGTAWRQVEALLNESHSLFELMTENKGLYIEEMMSKYVLPYIKKQMDNAEEISGVFEDYDIRRIDAKFVKARAVKNVNKAVKKRMFDMKPVAPDEQLSMLETEQGSLQGSLAELGNQRFFTPEDIDSKTWKDLFEDLEEDVYVDVTGESYDTQSAMTTLTTVMKTVASNPAILQDPNMKMLFNKILEITGTISPLEIASVPTPQPQPQAQPQLPAQASPTTVT